MSFDVLSGQAVVTVTLDPRTAVDHRMKRLDLVETLFDILENTGCSIERHKNGHRRFVRGLDCPHCGETWSNLEDHPAVELVTPTGECSYPRNPRRLRCTVCGGPPETSSAVFPRLVTKGRAKALDRYAITKLLNQDFTAVRCHGKTVISGGSFQQTAKGVVPKRLDLEGDVEAVLVRACSLDVATEALERDDFPADAWVTVPVTHELCPKAAWHSQPMTATDREPIERYRRQQRREAEAAIESEVAQFRAELVARQRA
jgi:hypothetical protein